MRFSKKDIDAIMSDLLKANITAEEFKFKYNQLSQKIEKAERSSPNIKNLVEQDIQKRIKDRRDRDEELASYYRGYSFQVGELTRLNTMLSSIKTYRELTNFGGPTVPIDVR